MIRVEVEEYCHSCFEFEPDVTDPMKLFSLNGKVDQTDTIIRCGHRKRCALLKKYLERQMKEKESNE